MVHRFKGVLKLAGALGVALLLWQGANAPAVAPDALVTTFAELSAATGGVAVDRNGNIFVADIGLAPARRGTTIYKITPQGEVSVFVRGQGLLGASGNAFDSKGNLVQSSLTGNRVHKITPDGEVSVFSAEGITGPVGVVLDKEDNVYVANCRSASVQKITPDGVSTRLVTSGLLSCPNGIALDDDNNVYVANFSNGNIIKITPDGEPSVFATVPGSRNLGHITYAGDGQFYVVSRGTHQIFTLTLDGTLTLLAGMGTRGRVDGLALESQFSLPNDLGISPDGKTLYVNEIAPTQGTANQPSVLRAIQF